MSFTGRKYAWCEFCGGSKPRGHDAGCRSLDAPVIDEQSRNETISRLRHNVSVRKKTGLTQKQVTR